MKRLFFTILFLSTPLLIFGEGAAIKIYTGGQAWRLCGIKPPPPPGKMPSEMVCACDGKECEWVILEKS